MLCIFFSPRKVFRHELAKSLAIPPLHTSLCVDWFKVRISAGVWDGRVVRVCVWNQTDIESLHIFCASYFPLYYQRDPTYTGSPITNVTNATRHRVPVSYANFLTIPFSSSSKSKYRILVQAILFKYCRFPSKENQVSAMAEPRPRAQC